MEAALTASQNVATLEWLLFLFYGVVIGLALSAGPGFSRPVELVILLPFTFNTTNIIPSVLFGTPGVFHLIVDVPWPEDLCLRGEAVTHAGHGSVYSYVSVREFHENEEISKKGVL